MDATEKIFCNTCKNQTIHSIETQHSLSDQATYTENDKEVTVDFGKHLYQVIGCRGCNAITFRYRNQRYGYYVTDEETNEDIFVAPRNLDTYFPERICDQIQIKQFPGIPPNLYTIYSEVANAYNRNSLILCASGLRSITEAICTYFKVEGDSLGDKIYNLGTQRLISKELSRALKTHKFLGNKALHELIAPTKEELKLALELIEDAFNSLFTVPFKHNDLKFRITKRVID